MAIDKDAFLPASFSKVQKIGKGLKSNGTSKSRLDGKNLDYERSLSFPSPLEVTAFFS